MPGPGGVIQPKSHPGALLALLLDVKTNDVRGRYLPFCLMGILVEDSRLSETISMLILLHKQLRNRLGLLLILSSCALPACVLFSAVAICY